jgi:tryptophanyl-tRNA synthetase
MRSTSRINKHGYWEIPDKKYRFDKGLAKEVALFADGFVLETIIDVGCGNGSYTFYLRSQGFDVDGFDGNPFTLDITYGECGVVDFADPVNLWARDLVLCLEVAEHIPKDREEIFIENILAPMSDYVIISWAIPGQGGLGHVNCRDNEYVEAIFSYWGYNHLKEWSDRMRKKSKLSWFKNTIMVYEYIGNRQ